ncbi:uncharacterized protein [Parasteatoda tepidariorum]|uniref:uncharacterized protein n=1 Tax=Parasteatoda tepidariorum TaxID=114398 RepID=UPI00077F8F49|nr:uncharacterized protein LOC107448419 [Parasteatoda tepidariorum]XP_042901257.1 uncharacterized protein LOC107448419 [Parasteatoda tepidariorum]
MDRSEENVEQDYFQTNETGYRSRSPTRIPYFIPRRPKVVKMRDLSPDTRNQLTQEYFEAYDPWTGIRIAATLGILISLFTLFLIYKSKFNRSKATLLPAKKTSLYLYDDDFVDCDLGSLGSSCRSSMLGMEFPYKHSVIDRAGFNFEDAFQLEEVLVKSSAGECVALKVHPPGRKSSKCGPKFGTLRITEDTPRSLPCSPYKPQQKVSEDTDVKALQSPTGTISSDPTSLTGSITSFGFSDSSEVAKKSSKKSTNSKNIKKSSKRSSYPVVELGKSCPKSMVVTTKKPQDYRSRSTIVSIARRQRNS